MTPWRNPRVWALIALWPALAAAQGRAPHEADPRESALRAAIAAEPGELQHYRALANFYRRQSRLDRADLVLREALAVDPLSRSIFEERVSLFADPNRPSCRRVSRRWLWPRWARCRPLVRLAPCAPAPACQCPAS